MDRDDPDCLRLWRVYYSRLEAFGHPVAGFFLARDFLTALFQSPLIFNRSGSGPRGTGVVFFAFLRMIWGRVVGQTLSFRRFDCQHCSLTVIQFATIPEEIKLPEIPVQIFLADIVVDADDAPLYQREGTLRRVRVNVTTGVLDEPNA